MDVDLDALDVAADDGIVNALDAGDVAQGGVGDDLLVVDVIGAGLGIGGLNGVDGGAAGQDEEEGREGEKAEEGKMAHGVSEG